VSDFKAKMHEIRFRLGLRPRPAGGAYSAPPDLLAGFKGPTSKGREERGWKGEGMGGRREGRGGEREGREKGSEGEGGACSKVLGGDIRPCPRPHCHMPVHVDPIP